MSKYEIIGIDKIPGVVSKHCLGGFTNLKDFHYYRPGMEHTYHLAMSLESLDQKCSIHVLFCDVTCLKIDTFGGNFVQLIDLTINNISDRGWENIFWIITDDDRKLSFYCSSVEVISVDP